MTPLVKDRQDAGRRLAARLAHWRDTPGLVVLALPRGGVPVAYEVAQALQAALDVFVVRKVGLPGQPEYAIGAIASGGVQVMDPLPPGLVQPEALARVLGEEHDELARREREYRGHHPPVALPGRSVIVVDDGMATGASMEAAVRALRQQHPQRLVVAVPVASPQAVARLAPLADEVVCLATPDPFRAVSLWYGEFDQCTDEQVQVLLEQARSEAAALAHH